MKKIITINYIYFICYILAGFVSSLFIGFDLQRILLVAILLTIGSFWGMFSYKKWMVLEK